MPKPCGPGPVNLAGATADRQVTRAIRRELGYHSDVSRPSSEDRLSSSARKERPLSLRQRMRLLGRDAILDAACDLFLARSYRTTTMAAIAAQARVGVATIFRYFKTKEGILAALSQRDIDKSLECARSKITPLPEDPVIAIVRLLTGVMRIHEMPSTRIRGQVRLWLLVPTGHSETDEVVTSSNRALQDIIHSVLTHYRAAGRIAKDLDLRDMTILIYAVFGHYYLRLALYSPFSVDEVNRELARQIALLFKAWTSPQLDPPVRDRRKSRV